MRDLQDLGSESLSAEELIRGSNTTAMTDRQRPFCVWFWRVRYQRPLWRISTMGDEFRTLLGMLSGSNLEARVWFGHSCNGA